MAGVHSQPKSIRAADSEASVPQSRFGASNYLNGKPRRNSESVRELRVLSTPEDSVKVTSVASDSPFVEATLAPSKLKELPGYVITATLKPGAPVGEFKAKLTVVSDHPKQPKAEIPITATIRGNIDLGRDSFFLGIIKKGKQAVANITLSTVGKDPLKLGKIDSPRSYLTVEAKPRIDGGYTLTATLQPDAPLGNIQGTVTVHTSDPAQPEIRIPVYAYVEQQHQDWPEHTCSGQSAICNLQSKMLRTSRASCRSNTARYPTWRRARFCGRGRG